MCPQNYSLIDSRSKRRIKKAIETHLTTVPYQYGEPLRKTLREYWKLRVGDYRVVFKMWRAKYGYWVLFIEEMYMGRQRKGYEEANNKINAYISAKT